MQYHTSTSEVAGWSTSPVTLYPLSQRRTPHGQDADLEAGSTSETSERARVTPSFHKSMLDCLTSQWFDPAGLSNQPHPAN